MCCSYFSILFFFNDTATTEIYTLSLHDALPISLCDTPRCWSMANELVDLRVVFAARTLWDWMPFKNLLQSTVRSEEHTSELQSQFHLVCRLLLEKKKINIMSITIFIILYFTSLT